MYYMHVLCIYRYYYVNNNIITLVLQDVQEEIKKTCEK